jgi:hypothetical protein
MVGSDMINSKRPDEMIEQCSVIPNTVREQRHTKQCFSHGQPGLGCC